MKPKLKYRFYIKNSWMGKVEEVEVKECKEPTRTKVWKHLNQQLNSIGNTVTIIGYELVKLMP